MKQELIAKFDKYQEEIKMSIQEYLDLVSNDLIPIFFNNREEILELIILYLDKIYYCKDIRSYSCYSFSEKTLYLGIRYTKATIIHEIHHILQTAMNFNYLKPRYKDKTEKEIIDIVNRHYLEYKYFFEGLALYWEMKYVKKYQVKYEKMGSSNENSLYVMYYLIERFGFKKIFEAEFKEKNIYYHIACNDANEIQRLYINLKLLSNINNEITKCRNMIEYLKDENKRRNYEEQLERLEEEKLLYLRAIKMISNLDNIT